MIDTHAHIDFEAFDEDRDAIINRAESAGIKKILVPGVEPKDFDRLTRTAEQNEIVYCGIGVHPHNASEVNQEVLDKVEKYSAHSKVVAIGEIGLDYFYDFCPKDLQREVFRKQLQIAKKVGLPVIIHNREADEDVLSILREEKDETLNGVLHCFSSDENTMKQAVELGFHISFTGNITFKKSQLSGVVKEVPLDRVMIETDSPFMTPVPFRGKRNEPLYVRYVAEKIAEIKSISIEEVLKMTTITAEKLFKFSAFIMFFLMSATLTFAQESEYDEDYIEDDEYYEDEDIEENPYFKALGFAPVFGTNTVIDTETFLENVDDKTKKGDDTDASYDGIFAPGFALFYRPFDFLMLEASYIYTKNTKIAELNDNLVDPSYHHIVNLTSHWIVNPNSKINFFGTVGLSYFHNSINKVIENDMGINGGIGFLVNFPTDFGLFHFIAEWRLDFQFSTKEGVKVISKTPYRVERSTWYSIPRAMIAFFPNF